ncbi:DUF2840 domain-containing protein [Roseibium sp. M-1]
MSEQFLTVVDLVFYPEFRNDRLRFGAPRQRLTLDKRRALAVFRPGALFGYLRWTANEFGTQIWSLAVGRTARPGEPITRLQGVRPGAEILLQLSGAARVKRILKHLDALETSGFALPEISPAYYRHLHNRSLTGFGFRPYSIGQQRAVQASDRVRG